jgi:hypothetical protein
MVRLAAIRPHKLVIDRRLVELFNGASSQSGKGERRHSAVPVVRERASSLPRPSGRPVLGEA